MKKHLLLLLLLLAGSIGLALAQTSQLTGTVKDDKGEGLPGVTVVLKGTTIGATTNVDGTYALDVPADTKNATLRFSFIGFVSQEVAVGSKTSINVSLVSDTQSLDDVVVIGYQAVQRRDVTGAVSSVSAQQLKDIPVNSAAEALTGRLAGVQLTSSEGTPGNTDVQVRVRGGNSITQDNSPLYVVDGIQIENALAVIAPQDIASVDVLKDASATAIYGARGANGVVIITTKGGREGRTSVNYNGFGGFRRITKTLGVMNPKDYIEWQYERAQQVGTATGGTATFKNLFGSLNYNGDTLNAIRNSPMVNWQKEVFGRDAFQQTHNVSVNGGAKGTTFALSLTSNREDGIQLGTGYERKLVNFRFDNKATDKFRFGLNVRFNDQESLGAGTGAALGTSTTGNTVATGSQVTSRLRNAVQFQPFNDLSGANALDPNAFDAEFFANSSLINPVLVINNEYRSDRRRTINIAANLGYNFTKNLVFNSVAGFDITNTNLSTFNGYYSPTIRQAAGNYQTMPFVTITTGLINTLNNSNTLAYTYRKDKHLLTALIGEETYQQKNTQQFVQTNFLPIDITAERALANINQAVFPAGVTSQPVPSTTSIPVNYTLLSGFGRLNYSYDDKYLLTLTGRYDGSSKFKGDNKTRFFPALAASWRLSRENFLKDVSAISDLKIRTSYGQTGNNRIADGLGDQLFTVGSVFYSLNEVLVPGSVATTLANPNLRWEITTARNLGLDLSLFNNRVQFTADAYYTTTNDLLVNVPLPAFTGYLVQQQNIGSTSNRGVELQLSGTVKQTSSFSWTATANVSFNRGRIEGLGNGAQEIQGLQSGWAGTAFSGTDYVARVGQPVGQMYGYVTDGWYTRDDFETYNYATRTGTLKANVANVSGIVGAGSLTIGGIKLKDQDGNNNITEADRVVIGNANPKATGGVNQQFTYKSFDASVFVNFVLGNDVYNANKIEFTSSTDNTRTANLLDVMNNRFKTIDENGRLITDEATFNRINANASIWQPTRNNYFLHSWAVESGSFLRINNITLGYSLPKALIAKAKLTQARFYVTLNNIYTITGYSGYDPEVNTRRQTPLTPGVDYAAYPRSRAFLFGVNLGL